MGRNTHPTFIHKWYHSSSDVTWYHDTTSEQTTVRLPDDLAEKAKVVARIQGKSVNQLIIDSLAIEIDRVRQDINNYSLEVPTTEVVTTMLSIASGQLPENELVGWIKQRAVPRDHK